MTGRKDAGALARALGEAAELREALSFVSVKCANTHCQYIDPRYLRPEGEGLIRRALASTPLAERAGEVFALVEDAAGYECEYGVPCCEEEGGPTANCWPCRARLALGALRTELGQG